MTIGRKWLASAATDFFLIAGGAVGGGAAIGAFAGYLAWSLYYYIGRLWTLLLRRPSYPEPTLDHLTAYSAALTSGVTTWIVTGACVFILLLFALPLVIVVPRKTREPRMSSRETKRLTAAAR